VLLELHRLPPLLVLNKTVVAKRFLLVLTAIDVGIGGVISE
jgi:hypothetical protein